MGTSIDAHCYGCGYDVGLMIGGGMRNFETFSSWPALCPRCPGITTTNLLAEQLLCLSCGSEVSLIEEAVGGVAEAAEWDRLKAANASRRSPPQPLDEGPATELENIAAALGLSGGRRARGEPSTTALADGDHALTKGRYRCPACGEPQLRFGTEFSGAPLMWD